MFRIFIILLVCLFINSCAAVINNKYTKIIINTTSPSKIIYNLDTAFTYENKVELNVLRNEKPVEITAINDSLKKNIIITSRNSIAYYLNIPCNWGLGMLIDKSYPEHYAYPSNIYVNTTDTLSEYFTYDITDKQGNYYLNLSLPYINFFQMQPDNESLKSNGGFFGLSLGLDYHHSQNQFIKFSLSTVADLIAPIGPIDNYGEYERLNSTYLGLTNNHRIWHFSIGYGISFGYNTWNLMNNGWDSPNNGNIDSIIIGRKPVSKSKGALGLIFSTYYQTGENLHIGINYRPTFYRFYSKENFLYEHLISIDFMWKIKI